MALSGGFRVEDGMIHNPAGFLGALSNVTKSAEDFITGRIGSSFGESNFAMFGAGDSPAASMIAAGSGQLSKLFAENARSLIAQQQGPGLSYDPVAEFMKMQGPEAPNFSGAAPAHSAPPPPAQRGGSNSLNIDASAKPSETIDDAKFKDTIADNKGYGENNAGQLLTIIQNKADGDVKKAKELLRSLPSSGGELWRRDFAEWYLTKILGKSAEEAKKVVEKRVYGKGEEVELTRIPKGDKKTKGVVTAQAFNVSEWPDSVEANNLNVVFYDSNGTWCVEDGGKLGQYSPLEGATGNILSSDNSKTTLTLRPAYRKGVEGMDVNGLIGLLKPGEGGGRLKSPTSLVKLLLLNPPQPLP
ncbi:MAG: hypothetical protein GX659_00825 [Myxococcales bacterium]|nr:hypothetical protein [Myxococcales bacterium]